VSHSLQGFWQITFDSFNVNGKAATGSLAAIMDTGTTQIVGDPTNVAAVYKNIPGAKEDDSLGQGTFTS